LDNCSVHTSGASEVHLAEHSLIWLKHRPSSPDPAPSDFYRFRTGKERLKDIEMVDEEDFFNRLEEISNEIPRKEFNTVFRAWINRLMTASWGDGG
jgi:hypothetical protein